MNDTALLFALAVPAVMMTGLAKGGFAGVGGLALPMMALAISPVRAAAILLPILVVQDVVGVWAFRKDWDGYVLGWTLPGAAIGIALGYIFAARVSADAVLGLVGVISLAFGAYRLWRERGHVVATSANAPGWVGALCGMASGFTSQVAHAGQPPFQIWVLPRRPPRDVLVGTTAIFFAIVNWAKVPAYWALGQFSRDNLIIAGLLLPVAILSTFGGVWMVRRIAPERFYTAIYVLMMLVGVKLIWDAVA
ncbi:sulfite exporter TauE/SafE family protein [Sphingomonas sp. GB1N7]|uniref:sulfite exporter TauE/SafE family protein n=1 Tax=Parasphingomonas caseinilytica TaxID=3096158 RepID=UPI002FCBADDC